ncbi:hypothetical protein [Salipaludibacillus sp. CF4.18]|uniref:hypothetical protein n=1 Tax=Salipaludibacillus sp. CF4.18 TaxID=3373081 RepID=UPI003EE731CD
MSEVLRMRNNSKGFTTTGYKNLKGANEQAMMTAIAENIKEDRKSPLQRIRDLLYSP